jgi:hypothetical protein
MCSLWVLWNGKLACGLGKDSGLWDLGSCTSAGILNRAQMRSGGQVVGRDREVVSNDGDEVEGQSELTLPMR